jgi:GAF domain-containing protein
VLRDGPYCYYCDENAIGPLWKGKRFPLERCISGWAMLNRVPVSIADIYADPRVPGDAYRPTFVKSLAMTPIRGANPLGALGAYWAEQHYATDDELDVLAAFAKLAEPALARTIPTLEGSAG